MRRTTPGTPALSTVSHCLNDGWIIRQAQVVVTGKIHHFSPVDRRQSSARRSQHPTLTTQPGSAQLIEFVLKGVFKWSQAVLSCGEAELAGID